MFTRNLQRVGAVLLSLGALAFVAVFALLKSDFNYPEILEQGAADVLPRLAAGGATLQAAWLLYGALPLTLFVAGIASMPLLENGGGRGLARLGGATAGLAAVFMMVGILRWPSIHHALAMRWVVANADQRSLYGALFDIANCYLGRIFGELLGELALAGWFACVGAALRRSDKRRAGTLVLLAATIVGLGALRQLTSALAPIAELSNVVLPCTLLSISAIMLQATREDVRGETFARAGQPRS